jgi:hypothetical protein
MHPPGKAEMYNLRQPVKQVYSEQEAANSLGISVNSLHSILDRHVFNDGAPRPEPLELILSEVLLIAYWAEQEKLGMKVVSIGKR